LSRAKTYLAFESIVGCREDFLAIPVAGQSRTSFLDMKPIDKLTFISRIIGIDKRNGKL